MMLNKPGDAFKCGPAALERIRNSEHIHNELDGKIFDTQSTQQGISLDRVCALANDIKMNYQMAKRAPGSKVIVPSVVNWKVGHYAALIRERNGRFLVQDPTAVRGYGGDIWISQKALDAEATGYFLVPAGALPDGWRTVSLEEGRTVFGKGGTSSSCPTCNGCPNQAVGGSGSSGNNTLNTGGCNCQPGGMATYTIYALLVSLNITDTPLRYSPPVGPAVDFTIDYNADDLQGVQSYSNLGNNWTFTWLSYIDLSDDLSASPPDPTVYSLYKPGGGGELYTWEP